MHTIWKLLTFHLHIITDYGRHLRLFWDGVKKCFIHSVAFRVCMHACMHISVRVWTSCNNRQHNESQQEKLQLITLIGYGTTNTCHDKSNNNKISKTRHGKTKDDLLQSLEADLNFVCVRKKLKTKNQVHRNKDNSNQTTCCKRWDFKQVQ